MKKSHTALAVSPTPECICLAAACRDHWHSLAPAGSKLISDVLETWRRDHAVSEAIILVPDISEPQRVRDALRKLSGRGVRVRWIAPRHSTQVFTACKGLDVELFTGDTVRSAFGAAFGGAGNTRLLGQLDARNQDLEDFLGYKISLLLMRAFHPEPLEEAVAALVKNKDEVFSLKSLSAADAQSVSNFRDNDFPYFQGKSEAIRRLKERIIQVAPTDMGVLISGETGVGKEAVAFYIHEFSNRRSGPLICLNCAGLDETFLRSELFGHEKGAFTGAIAPKKGLVQEAEAGTLFLDELADMPLEVQADLLRFLQTRRYRSLGGLKVKRADIRVIAAAQPVLFEKLETGEFRPDLYYRLSEIVLEAPSLAQVPDDIIRVVRHLAYSLSNRVQDIQETIRYFENGMDILQAYDWPGNVRELSSLVKRKILLGDDVLPEIRVRPNRPQGVDFSKALPLRDAADIIPIEDLVTGYVRHVRTSRPELTQRELAKRLGKSLNTVKKYFPEG